MRIVALAAVVAAALLGLSDGVAAQTAAPSPSPTPWATPWPPLIPCEWYPKDRSDSSGEWWVPLTDDSCPQMTLPPTDTD